MGKKYYMTFDERTKYFLELDCDDKFNYNSFMKFPDGKLINSWLYYELLNNFDNLTIEQKSKYFKQKQEHLNIHKLKCKEIRENVFIENKVKNMLPYEFLSCNDNRKYKKGSELKFKCGISMYKWFFENIDFIFASEIKVYKEIRVQYQNYLIKRKNLDFEKKKRLFYVNKNLNKFSLSDNLTFFDGEFMSFWFKNNINKFINSNDIISKQIIKQKQDYDILLSLKKRFLLIENKDKFDKNSNVRFLSGALAYDFFESILSSLFESNDEIDKQIIDEYKSYLKEKSRIIKKMK